MVLYVGMTTVTIVFVVVTSLLVALLFVGVMLAKHGPNRKRLAIEIPPPEDPSSPNRMKIMVSGGKGFQFTPFLIKGAGVPLRDANLPKDEELLLIERHGERLLFVAREMGYHHLAQGELAGEPYAVSF